MPDSYSRITWIYAFIIDPQSQPILLATYIDSYLHARDVAIFHNKMLIQDYIMQYFNYIYVVVKFLNP